jgi:hypothetical protein
LDQRLMLMLTSMSVPSHRLKRRKQHGSLFKP